MLPGESILGMATIWAERRCSEVWNSAWVGRILWLSGAAFAAYWYFKIPTPGKAIGLLAVSAGIMSVRKMKVLAQTTWVVLLVCMLFVEFRAIDKDHEDNEQKQKDFFAAQKQGFSDIAQQAGKNFAETSNGLESAIDGLDTAIGGINTTLSTANETLRQTRPEAYVELGRVHAI